MSGPIVLAAGGTGGHVFPAQALAAELLRRGRQVALLTDARGGRHQARFPGCAIHVVPSATPSVAGVIPKLRAGFDLARGTLAAGRLLRGLDASIVVGFGGYPSLPPLLAATRQGRPSIVHEQNALLGRVNRLLARHVDAIALSFPQTSGLRPADAAKALLTGNPVRDGVRGVRDMAFATPANDDVLRLLVLGGSQGATITSDMVPPALASLPESLRLRLRVTQQCRAEDLERVRTAYVEAGIWAETATFIADVPQRLAACHLAITRSGASTVAELAVAGRPAILIPYVHATDDHQRFNAEALAQGGAAIVALQRDLTPASLAAQLSDLFMHPNTLVTMALAARGFGRPDAAMALADLVEARARNGHPVEKAA
jgi:UDP-N-acetylglucosamine--N-acetylmuramyl-(pentapeptide) pyrophosphoryl-undecaprenol N-acetylglucosamine transferase